MPQQHEAHHGWRYALIALAAAALVLAALAAIQFARTYESTTTGTSAIPAEYAGVSLPQAMRLADAAALAATSAIPAEYAGVSLPQAMRLADAAATSAIPAIPAIPANR
jgi:TRAP-type C4-dicarboxylate transport system permease small subunit